MSKNEIHINNRSYQKVQLIHNVDLEAGFTALMLYALNGIRKAEENNRLPVVYFDKKNTSHFYEEAYGENIWEYFFEPVAGVSYTELNNFIINAAINPKNVYKPSGAEINESHRFEEERIATFWSEEEPENKVEWMTRKRKLGRSFVKKHIRVKPLIQEKVNQFYKDNFSADRIFGIHIRGTDFAYANPTTVEQYAKELDLLIDQNKNKSYQIFLATDQEQFVQYFNEKYPDKLITYDAIRSQNDIAPFRFKNVSPYKKGEDVLIDILLLSKCNYLLKGAAAVGEMALWFNESLQCTDFGLDSKFDKAPIHLLDSAYSRLNIDNKSSFSLRTRKNSKMIVLFFQNTFPFSSIRRAYLFFKNR